MNKSVFARLKWLLIVSLLIVLGCDSTTPEEYFDSAYAHIENEEYSLAIIELDKALEKRPDFRPALIQRGYCKLQLADEFSAIDDFMTLLKYDPDNTLALYNLGACYYNLNQFNEAISYYSLALKTDGARDPKNNEPVMVFADDLDNEENYFIETDDIRFDRGTALVRSASYGDAINDLEYVIQQEDYPVETHYWLANAYLGTQDTISACDNYRISAEYGIAESMEYMEILCGEVAVDSVEQVEVMEPILKDSIE